MGISDLTMRVCMSDQARSRTRETLTLRKRGEYSTLEDYAYTVHFSRHLYLFIYLYFWYLPSAKGRYKTGNCLNLFFII
jgi:hypothetical protein